MTRLNLKAVEERVKPLAGRALYDRQFVFDLLAAYGRSPGNITRLKNGSLNVAEHPETEVAQKGVVYFAATTDDPLAVADTLRTSPAVIRHATRFVIATDFTTLVAVDTKTAETLVTPIAQIDQHFTFFLPWAGMEKAQNVAEAHADVKAAERMARLFDEIVSHNPQFLDSTDGRHGLLQVAAAADTPDTGTATTHEVVITVTAAELEQRHGQGWAFGVMADLPMPVVERAACAGTRRLAVLGDRGEPLYLSRAHRLFSPAQRKALTLAAGGRCQVPGCRVPAPFLDAPHVDWYSRDGGATRIDNGIMLCSHHHHVVHANRAQIEIRRHRGDHYVVPANWTGPPDPLHRCTTGPPGEVRAA